MRLGARMFKTGLAVTLALYAAMWLDFSTPAFAALAAFFAVQPSLYKSMTLIWDQIQANIISAVLAVTFVLAFGPEPFVIGVVVVLIIAIHIRWRREAIIPLAVVTAVIIMGSPTDDFLPFALDRFLLIMIGVFSASAVNMIFLPPNHENQLYHKLTAANEEIIQWIRLILHHEIDYSTLKQDQDKIRSSIQKLDTIFDLYRQERSLFRKKEYSRMRKIVLFRQMIRTTSKAENILESLARHDHVTHQLPPEVEEIIQHQLDALTNYHERIMLKYMGKVRPQSFTMDLEEVTEGRATLVEVFMHSEKHAEFKHETWIHFLPVIALIIEYSEELEHLDKLVDGFFTYHTDDNEVDIAAKEL
ncbi:FUSC family protein [Alkalicoccus luteus]|uniref:Aromatic acid exporter family protein n=1 Tax=Alkalicoccus luteus TaxID=1237094 RepID=A0A969TUX6_9BACI|nr:aromatic acid exporter family protein [Alkalicoccus luteus]NJP37795.1 aromatic acid exporter family protein [Alkalicoccus luteus]